MPTDWLDQAIKVFCEWMPADTFFYYTFNVRALLAIVLVSLIGGAVGSLVVGNRMSFFSDALAHVAFAGAALGWLIAFSGGLLPNSAAFNHSILWTMIGLGVLVGVGIAYVREVTALASDTVIGVFFAGAMGFGVMLLKNISQNSRFTPETFIFGDLNNAATEDIFYLLGLLLVTAVGLVLMYNTLLFASFNLSLARSRRLSVRLYNYLFIVLLGLIVNLSFRVVGVLLITSLLVVPAATAANLCRNMRQLFWCTILLSLTCSVAGMLLSWEMSNWTGGQVKFVQGGTIAQLSVLLFFASLVWRRAAQRTGNTIY